MTNTKTKFCPKCGSGGTGKFCVHCGLEKFEIPACECGYDNIWPHEKFCQECGRAVKHEHITASTPAEQCGMSETQYRQAESLYLHGDLSGR